MKLLRCAFSRPEQIPEGIPACCEHFPVKTYFLFLHVTALLILYVLLIYLLLCSYENWQLECQKCLVFIELYFKYDPIPIRNKLFFFCFCCLCLVPWMWVCVCSLWSSRFRTSVYLMLIYSSTLLWLRHWIFIIVLTWRWTQVIMLYRYNEMLLYSFSGYAVAQLDDTLRYKLEGNRFDTRWGHWNYSLTSSSNSRSERNE
jgi:hypothetical protein